VARYWVYINEGVAGPYALEQLIRLRGFSRQTQVCIDDASGKPTTWISPADIPELVHIFKAADDQHVAAPPISPNKAPSKPVAPRAAKPYTPAVTLRAPPRNMAQTWASVILVAALLAGGIFTWIQYARRGVQTQETAAAKALVENARLPAPSPYGTLGQYIQEKAITPRWELEKVQDALYHVTLSWYAPALTVYAFEANVQAQTVRGLNTAALKLLSEGFPAPQASTPKSIAAPKRKPLDLFSEALDHHRETLEGGDFTAVWNSFSQRKKSEMAKGGISQEGFTRLQSLTHGVDSATKQTVLKTKEESETEMLVLLKQTQSGHPDIFIKQFWVFEDDAWKLDDEQKRSAQNAAAGSQTPGPMPESSPSEKSDSKPSNQSSVSTAPNPAVKPAALPGMSN
jgi:hypothetical protein